VLSPRRAAILQEQQLRQARVKTARPVSFERHSEPRGVHIFLDIGHHPDWNPACFLLKREAGMGLQIEQRERENIIILDLKGRLVLGDEDISLLQRLLFLLDSRHRKVILNIIEVSDIDSSGLDTLAFCSTRFHDIGGRLVLLHTCLPGAEVTEILKRSAGVEIYRDETDAVQSFFFQRLVPRYDILEFVKEQQQLRNRNSEVLGQD
jgi:anti-sigma B factor antagonist